MNQRTEASVTQIASDVHLMTWPMRFVIDFIKTTLFVLAFVLAVPTLFVVCIIHYIVTGHALLTPDNGGSDAVWVLKGVISFCMPFILPIVYRLAQWGGRRRRAEVKATYVVNMHWLFPLVLLLMIMGAIFAYPWWDQIRTEVGLGVLVLYLASPLLLLFLKRSLPDDPQRFPGH